MCMTKRSLGVSGEENTAGSVLLELSAADDLIGFKQAVEEDGSAIDEAGFWYGRSTSDKKMGFLQRTPLMVAALFGSTAVLKYILSTYKTCGIDVNRASISDDATALHCAAFGGSLATAEVVKLLVDASADVNSLDANGNRPGDLVVVTSPVLAESIGALKALLNINHDGKSPSAVVGRPLKPEKKEYPVDPSMPDINNGLYSTDEFRMYTFKVKPCSRAYSHDWTECPFVHPGENARRRDPRRHHYSCVPCPDFRKGNCVRGDACEYAHGVFECWLHPAQYRTRLCKDEVGCNRRICFFAHKPEELRSLYPSTGSAIPSPRSSSREGNPIAMSPLNLNSTSVLLSTPPMSPTTSSVGSNWQFGNLHGSRLKATLSARDLIMDDLVELEDQQKLLDDLASLSSSPPVQQPRIGSLAAASLLSSPAGSRSGKFRAVPTASAMQSANLENLFASELMSQMAAVDSANLDRSSVQQLKAAAAAATMAQMQSTMRSSLNYGLSSSPARTSSPRLGSERSGGSSLPAMSPSLATALINSSRSAAFTKRSMSFCDHGGASMVPSAPMMDNWSSPAGKLDWGVQGDELNKLRKSASFAVRNNLVAVPNEAMAEGPDVSWVQSLLKDGPTGCEFDALSQDQLNAGFRRADVSGVALGAVPWMDQLYMEQEQMVS